MGLLVRRAVGGVGRAAGIGVRGAGTRVLGLLGVGREIARRLGGGVAWLVRVRGLGVRGGAVGWWLGVGRVLRWRLGVLRLRRIWRLALLWRVAAAAATRSVVI